MQHAAHDLLWPKKRQHIESGVTISLCVCLCPTSGAPSCVGRCCATIFAPIECAGHGICNAAYSLLLCYQIHCVANAEAMDIKAVYIKTNDATLSIPFSALASINPLNRFQISYTPYSVACDLGFTTRPGILTRHLLYTMPKPSPGPCHRGCGTIISSASTAACNTCDT